MPFVSCRRREACRRALRWRVTRTSLHSPTSWSTCWCVMKFKRRPAQTSRPPKSLVNKEGPACRRGRAARMTITRTSISYLEVVDWGDHLHPDLTRKAKPPFRWLKLQTENLDVLGDLSLREYGAYCRVLNLAALTNNRMVYNANAIKRRTGITPKDVQKLQNRGLIRIVSRTSGAENLKKNSLRTKKLQATRKRNPSNLLPRI